MTKKRSKEDICLEAVEWYTGKRSLFEQLANKVNIIITDILKEEDIAVHEVCSRAKEINSFTEKIKDEKYDNPINQITDLTGIRIITYVESDLKKICDIINANFVIDHDNSSDKGELLGIDRVGYKSIHYICSLPHERTEFTDYKKYKNVKFEIQIRTILQHTWAEVEHDRNYKFTGLLPKHLQRRFKILAGVLELADRELDSIALEIDEHKESVTEDAKKGRLNIAIDSTSLKSYLGIKFKDLSSLYKPTIRTNILEQEVLKELNAFGIETLEEFDKIIPKDFKQKSLTYVKNSNYIGLLRNIMMINNAEKYFHEVWKYENWNYISNDTLLLLKSYNIPIEDYLKDLNIKQTKEQ